MTIWEIRAIKAAASGSSGGGATSIPNGTGLIEGIETLAVGAPIIASVTCELEE